MPKKENLHNEKNNLPKETTVDYILNFGQLLNLIIARNFYEMLIPIVFHINRRNNIPNATTYIVVACDSK